MATYWGQQLPDPPEPGPAPPDTVPDEPAPRLGGDPVPEGLFSAAYVPGGRWDEQPETD